ncbi:TPA: hypothetical protein SMF87_004560 [Serratia marcescens]|nr:hypothetical protein [Serratia marcescens]
MTMQNMLKELIEAANDCPRSIGMTDHAAMEKYSRFLRASHPSNILRVIAHLQSGPADDVSGVLLEAYEEARREIAYLQAACDFAGEILKNKRAPGGADDQ